MLELRQLSYTYAKEAMEVPTLSSIDFTLGKNEVCAMIGPSGCGKSTLLHLVAGILKQQKGEVLLNGVPLCVHRDHISFVPQNLGLLPWKNVRANCLLPFIIKKQPITQAVEGRLKSICTRLGIEKLMKKYPHELSGGQKQRVALARAFIIQSDVLLMDEPFSALDALIKEEAMTLFLELWKEHETPTLFVTHQVDEALYMGKKIMIMGSQPGRIIKVIENPLFMNNRFKEDTRYGELVSEVQQFIKGGSR